MNRSPLKCSGFIRRQPAGVTKARKIARSAKARVLGHVSKSSRLENLLDMLWPQAVKVLAGGKCEASCLLPSQCAGDLEAHHYVRRRHKLTRWDVANGICLCRAHHAELHANAFAEQEVFIALRGMSELDRLDALRHAEYVPTDLTVLVKLLKTAIGGQK